MKMEVFDWEPNGKGKKRNVVNWLPTFDDLEKAEMTHCPYQTRLPFDVDSFKENVKKCALDWFWNVFEICHRSGFGRSYSMVMVGENVWSCFDKRTWQWCMGVTGHARRYKLRLLN